MMAQAQADGYLSHVTATSRVLDVGVGTGLLSRALVAQMGLPLRVDGIDISAEMLPYAHANLCAVGAQPALRVADVRKLEAVAQYDVVLAAHVLEHLADPTAALCRMTRALKAGGVLFLSVTRQGWWGRYIRRQWHIQPVTPVDVHLWCGAADLYSVQRLRLGAWSWRNSASVAVVARKG